MYREQERRYPIVSSRGPDADVGAIELGAPGPGGMNTAIRSHMATGLAYIGQT